MSREPPTDQEIWDQHGSGIEIRRSMPSNLEIKERFSWIDRIFISVGYEKWMWRSIPGSIIGIIVIPPATADIINFWKPIINSGYEVVEPYLEALVRTNAKFDNDLIAFSEKNHGDRFAIVPSDEIIPQGITEISRKIVSANFWRCSNYVDVSGRGGLVVSGSWHTKGHLILYLSGRMIDAIDAIKKQMPVDLLPITYNIIEIFAQGTIEEAPSFRVGDGSWDYEASRAYGDKWLLENRTSILSVPKTDSKFGTRYLINVQNSDVKIHIKRSAPLISLYREKIIS